MNGHDFVFFGCRLTALGLGALFWPDERLLAVTDLHLGKSERMARRGGALVPPYETRDTLARLDAAISTSRPATVLCLGDSFDDSAAATGLDEAEALWLTRLQAGRRWVWITGNHDPAPVPFPGSQLAELAIHPLTFRHIARPEARGEVSGHYHPKARLSARGRGISRPCFLVDKTRVILPAFGTYTGGLGTHSQALSALMEPGALAILTGNAVAVVPIPT